MAHWFYITPEEYALAESNGISSVVLEIRIRSLGWPKDRALTESPQKKHRIADWVELAESNGICYSTLRHRINRLGWEPERAATQPLQDRAQQARRAHETSRKYDPDFVRAAESNGIPADIFRRRVRSGWTPERAYSTPIMTPSEIGLLTKEKRARYLQQLFPRRKRKSNGR